MPRLEVKVGPDRFNMERCRLNDTKHPHEIDTEHFCGRVLVRVLDAPGARVGEPGREYFQDRTRRFCIQIEGRFKKYWTGDDILFGSDFDMFVPFPRAPFNAGMRVARMIDPCTFYEEHPPSGRPYIMSPYAACMNTFCAWPSPDRLGDAVVVSNDHGDIPSYAAEHGNDGDIVPVERIDYSHSHDAEKKSSSRWFPSILGSHKDERVTNSYWRFLGLSDDPAVQAYIRQHPPSRPGSADIRVQRLNTTIPIAPAAAMDVPTPVVAPVPSLAPAPSLQRPIPIMANPMPRRLQQGIDTHTMTALGSSKKPNVVLTRLHLDRPNTPDLPVFLSSNLSLSSTDTFGSPGMTQSPVQQSPIPMRPGTARMLERRYMTPSPASSLHQNSSLNEKLGPWRFSDPSSDMVEDNAFIFKTESVSVPKRRKYFSDEAHRKSFVYHPDIVYGASFFTNLFDFNTFDLNIGPVHINVHPFFQQMPIRYTLRSKTNEELVFCTISFQLVD